MLHANVEAQAAAVGSKPAQNIEQLSSTLDEAHKPTRYLSQATTALVKTRRQLGAVLRDLKNEAGFSLKKLTVLSAVNDLLPRDGSLNAPWENIDDSRNTGPVIRPSTSRLRFRPWWGVDIEEHYLQRSILPEQDLKSEIGDTPPLVSSDTLLEETIRTLRARKACGGGGT